MSRHYLVMRQSALQNQDQGVDEILRKLSVTRPELAKRLMAVEWEPIIKFVAREALELAAKRCNCKVTDNYDNASYYGSDSGSPPEGGECVGVLHNSYWSQPIQLGVAIKGTKLSIFANRWSEENSEIFQPMKDAFETAYKEEALKAALRLIGGEVKREEHDGVVILQTMLKGGGK